MTTITITKHKKKKIFFWNMLCEFIMLVAICDSVKKQKKKKEIRKQFFMYCFFLLSIKFVPNKQFSSIDDCSKFTISLVLYQVLSLGGFFFFFVSFVVLACAIDFYLLMIFVSLFIFCKRIYNWKTNTSILNGFFFYFFFRLCTYQLTIKTSNQF